MSFRDLFPDLNAPITGSIFPSIDNARIADTQAGQTAAGGEVGFGGRFVNLAGRALRAFEAARGLPIQRFDVLDENFVGADDAELMKVVAKYGAIPAESDIGRAAVIAGAKVDRQTITFSDGTRETIPVVRLGRSAKPKAARKNLTSNRLQTAAWVMRKLKAQQRLGKRLAAVAQSLYPRKRAEAPTKGKR